MVAYGIFIYDTSANFFTFINNKIFILFDCCTPFNLEIKILMYGSAS